MILKIKNNPTVDDLEELYSQLAGLEPIDLLLPEKVNDIEFGIVAAITQFVVSWQRGPSAGSLLLRIDGNLDDIESLVREEFIFPSIIICWGKGIFDQTKTTHLNSLIRPIYDAVLLEMQALNKLKGFRALLTCFDHLPNQQGQLECFYSNGTFVSSDGVLSFSLNSVIKHVIGFSKDLAKKNVSEAIDPLLAIIYELMKNTDDWGRTDVDLKPLSPNVRGVFLKFRKARLASYKDRFKDHEGLYDYFDAFQPSSAGEIYFLEISVFDSGIGYIEKFLGKKSDPSLDINDEVSVIKSCLIKRNTSATGIERDSKGLGLDRIMQLLNGKGFFTIRTAKAFVYRNMRSSNYVNSANINEVMLFDWRSNSSGVFTEFNRMVGSNITIVYPISDLR